MPTILELADVPAPHVRGRWLVASNAAAPIYSESLYARIHLGCGELRSIVDEERHVIDGAHAEVYDLRNDPLENVNVIDRERRAYANARNAIAQVGGAFVTPDAINADEAKKLAALGYVTGGSDSGATSRDPRTLGSLAAQILLIVGTCATKMAGESRGTAFFLHGHLGIY